VRDAQGRVLLAQRPPGKDLAGFWEFPGGKVEPGETAEAALARELHEELGIRARIGRRRIAVPFDRIVLDVHEVSAYEGTLHPRENQRIAWIEPQRIERAWLPAADWPVVTSLRLPERYLITPVPATGGVPDFLVRLESALADGIRLVQLRLPGWPRAETAALARPVRDLCRAHGAHVLLNADFELAGVLGLDGVHLPFHAARTLRRRPMAGNKWVGVSCHNAGELAHAAAIGADFATLSPVRPTSTHAQAVPLGWACAALLLAEASLPVYALGGLDRTDLCTSHEHGFQGIAAIRALWP
jgi:8-oxo-dGTP diphosphatase